MGIAGPSDTSRPRDMLDGSASRQALARSNHWSHAPVDLERAAHPTGLPHATQVTGVGVGGVSCPKGRLRRYDAVRP